MIYTTGFLPRLLVEKGEDRTEGEGRQDLPFLSLISKTLLG